MTKHLKEYGDFGDVLGISYIASIWAKVIVSNVREVYVDEIEMYYFVMYFLPYLPHDWTNDNFMGVQLLRKYK